MADLERLLEAFVAAFEAGERPDPNEWVEGVSDVERQELSSLIDRYLMTAPRRAWDPKAYETSLAKAAVDQVYESIEGVSGSWPELLPHLRNRARVKRSELVARLSEALGVGSEPRRLEKVADYYNRMEHGWLPAEGVSGRVIEALAGIVGVDPETLRSAGRGAFSSPVVEEQAFARTVLDELAYSAASEPDADALPAPPASPGTAGRDEIDELFTGG